LKTAASRRSVERPFVAVGSATTASDDVSAGKGSKLSAGVEGVVRREANLSVRSHQLIKGAKASFALDEGD
jgi:hypothetical protein